MVAMCVCVTSDTDIRVITTTTTIISITTTTITATKFPNITKTTISNSYQNLLCGECDRFGGRLGCQILTLWTRVFEHRLILVSYRGFGANYRCHLLKSSCPRTLKMGQKGFNYTKQRCITSQKGDDLIYTAAEAWYHAKLRIYWMHFLRTSHPAVINIHP